jgi:integrase
MLTKSQIDRAERRQDTIVLWDDVLAGFGCRVYPTGRRTFVVKYRLPGDRRTVWVTLGSYGVLTMAEARAKARDVLRDARLGADPQVDRKIRKAKAQAITVPALMEQYLTALHAGKVTSKRLKGRRAVPEHLADVERHLRRFAAALGRMPANAVTRGDVVQVLASYASQPSVHRRMHGAISRLYAWARHQELVTNNPADDIETTAPAARERVLSLEELAAIWRAAEELDLLYRDYTRLMILTGQRRTEVAGMTWDEVQLGAGLWVLPAARTKARRQHVVPLPALAVTLLAARYKEFQLEPERGALVLPTLSRDSMTVVPISGWNWLKRELDRRVALPPWHLHDFRRSIVTILAEAGADIAVLDSMLNHAASGTRGGIVAVYQRATLVEPMRKAMALWNSLLAAAINPPADDAKVVSLRA